MSNDAKTVQRLYSCVINANKIIWFIEYASGNLCFTAQCSRVVCFLGRIAQKFLLHETDREIKWKIRCADTWQRWTWIVKQMFIYIACCRSVSFGFILANSSTSYSFAGLAFFLKKSLLRMWEMRMRMKSNQTDALPSPLSLAFIVLFSCECRIQIFNRSHADTHRFTYVKIYIVSIFWLIMMLSAKWAG